MKIDLQIDSNALLLRCADQPGEYQGDQTVCDPNPCLLTPVEATSWGKLKVRWRARRRLPSPFCLALPCPPFNPGRSRGGVTGWAGERYPTRSPQFCKKAHQAPRGAPPELHGPTRIRATSTPRARRGLEPNEAARPNPRIDGVGVGA